MILELLTHSLNLIYLLFICLLVNYLLPIELHNLGGCIEVAQSDILVESKLQVGLLQGLSEIRVARGGWQLQDNQQVRERSELRLHIFNLILISRILRLKHPKVVLKDSDLLGYLVSEFERGIGSDAHLQLVFLGLSAHQQQPTARCDSLLDQGLGL